MRSGLLGDESVGDDETADTQVHDRSPERLAFVELIGKDGGEIHGQYANDGDDEHERPVLGDRLAQRRVDSAGFPRRIFSFSRQIESAKPAQAFEERAGLLAGSGHHFLPTVDGDEKSGGGEEDRGEERNRSIAADRQRHQRRREDEEILEAEQNFGVDSRGGMETAEIPRYETPCQKDA